MRGEPLISILIPALDEEIHIEALLEAALTCPLVEGHERELVVVDDGSTDATPEILTEWAAQDGRIRVFRHGRRRGKGAAVRTALAEARGEFSVVLDADLEYSPSDLGRVLEPLVRHKADAVFGSRFGYSEQRRVLYFWHSVANHLLTSLANMVADVNLTDVMTGAKAFRTSMVRSIPLRSDGFNIEVELTMKLAQRGARIYEVPVSYHGRGYAEGKKIRLKDALLTPLGVLWYGLRRDIYLNPGARILDSLARTPNFNKWMASVVAPHLGARVLEIGAGIGNLTALLSRGRKRYAATDLDEEHVERLAVRFASNPRISTGRLDASDAAGFERWRGEVDSVVCLNVLEHVENERAGFSNLCRVLPEGGRAVVLVPQDQGLFGTLDEVLGHFRRYTAAELKQRMEEAGFEVERVFEFNRLTRPGWWMNGRVMKRRSFSRLQLAVFDSLVWLWRRMEGWLPWGGVSVIAVGRKRAPN